MRAPGAQRLIIRAAAQQRFGFGQHGGLRGNVGEPSAAAARKANHEVAEVRAEAVRAAKQFAVVQNAEPKAALDVDDEKVVQVARLSKPVLGERRRD